MVFDGWGLCRLGGGLCWLLGDGGAYRDAGS